MEKVFSACHYKQTYNNDKDKETYEAIVEMGRNNDYPTGNLLD